MRVIGGDVSNRQGAKLIDRHAAVVVACGGASGLIVVEPRRVGVDSSEPLPAPCERVKIEDLSTRDSDLRWQACLILYAVDGGACFANGPAFALGLFEDCVGNIFGLSRDDFVVTECQNFPTSGSFKGAGDGRYVRKRLKFEAENTLRRHLGALAISGLAGRPPVAQMPMQALLRRDERPSYGHPFLERMHFGERDDIGDNFSGPHIRNDNVCCVDQCARPPGPM